MGVEVSKLTFYTSAGRVALNMWDLAGDDKLGGLRDGYLLNADGVIYMYDVTDSSSYDAIPDWIKLNGRINENIPAVIAGTKVDLPNKAVSKPTLGKKHSLQLYEISSLSNFNFEKPFLFLIRRLLADPDIEFVEAPALYME